MINRENLIYKYDKTKVDIGIKKSNRTNSSGWSKSDTNEKNSNENK